MFIFISSRRSFSWFIITSDEIDTIQNKKDNNNSSCKTVVIDPGIRTFLTCLDSDNRVFEIGKDFCLEDKFRTRINKIDIGTKISLVGLRKQERYTALKAKRSVELHRRKVRDLVNEMHKKTARTLLDNYDVIVLPKLRSKSILKRIDKGGVLGKETNRNIGLLSHCKFHDYLTWKAGVEGKIVIDQNEAFTTQTCFGCGLLNDIGSSKVYSCKFCGNKCDRDIQSCYNILTRYMSSYSSTI